MGRICAYCPAVEVFLYREDKSLVLWDALDLVTPFSCNLDSRLYSLSARVHGQDHLKAHHLGDSLGETREDIVVEGAGTKSESRSLVA